MTTRLQRRLRAIVRSGVMARIGSEGRLVWALAAFYADPESLAFTMSARAAAREAGAHLTTIRRGVKQLLEVGVLEVRACGSRRRYRIAGTTSTVATEVRP